MVLYMNLLGVTEENHETTRIPGVLAWTCKMRGGGLFTLAVTFRLNAFIFFCLVYVQVTR